jgi:nucleolar protein 56
MKKFILYSNCVGSYLFNPDFSIKEKLEFKNIDEIIKNSEKLEKGEFIETEKKLIKKYGTDKIIFFGFKSEKEKIEFSQDSELFKRISLALNKTLPSIHKNNLLITKQKIKDSVKPDLLIVQTINNIDELSKIINTLAKRLREWYEFYNPEFSKSVQDHEKFCELILEKNKKQLLEQVKLKESESMGAELAKKDLDSILLLAGQINNLFEYKEKQTKYLEDLMKRICPNLLAITGSLIGAKLLAIAGNLKKLMSFPASTIQLLGAEKALFRHIRTGAKPPKFGVLMQHPLITNANKENKGKIARALADKISIAVKIDYFKGKFAGDKLRKEIEAKFK